MTRYRTILLTGRYVLKHAVILGVIVCLTGIVHAEQTIDYSWEDGGTILSFYGNLANPANVSSGSDPGTNNQEPSYDPPLTVLPRTGTGMLEVMEDPHSSTPQAYVAYIEYLTEGDIVTASFYGWDSTEGTSPSLRVWGHYALNGDIDSYTGSAGGNADYTVGVLNGQWSQVQYTWTVDAGQEALVVEARLYSTPSTSDVHNTNYWIDDLQVTAPDSAVINIPAGSATPTPTGTPECINDGDVTLDGTLTSEDAQQAFFIVLGLFTPTYEEECAADCNGDASVTAEDAQVIFMSVLGMATCVDPIS